MVDALCVRSRPGLPKAPSPAAGLAIAPRAAGCGVGAGFGAFAEGGSGGA